MHITTACECRTWCRVLAGGGRCILSTPLRAPGLEEDRRSLANIYTCAVDAAHESWRKKPNGGINLPPPKKIKMFLLVLFMYIGLAEPADGIHCPTYVL